MTLSEAAALRAFPPFRLKQISCAREQKLITSFSDITTLSQADRTFLTEHVPFDTITPRHALEAPDHSAIKFLMQAADQRTFETVLLIHSGKERTWGTVCVSSQIGCPVGCSFCATGQMQLLRNLTTEEITDQYLLALRVARKKGITGNLNIVFMGMGEPLLNYDAVIPAIRTFIDPLHYGLSPSRITLSTSGIVPGLKKLFKEKLNIGIALSLHAPTDPLRTRLMPVNRAYPLASVMDTLIPFERSGTEVLYEYVLIDGVNDSPKEADGLIQLLSGRNAKLNLIPLNPVPGTGLARPALARMRAFLARVTAGGIAATLRHTKGDDIAAACGQLKTTQDAQAGDTPPH